MAATYYNTFYHPHRNQSCKRNGLHHKTHLHDIRCRHSLRRKKTKVIDDDFKDNVKAEKVIVREIGNFLTTE